MAARMTTAFCAACALLGLTSCSWWSNVTYPIPPVANGSDQTPIAFEHFVQVSWSSTDLSLLRSLDVQYPAEVLLVPSTDPSPGGDELQVEIHFDVEKPNDAAYSQAFLQQIQAASNLDAQNAVLRVPAPQEACTETQNAEGQVTSLQGICVRELVITVPASHPIPITVAPGGDFSATEISLTSLQLTLPPTGAVHADIEKLVGNLAISGGSQDAILTVNQLGDPTAKAGDLSLLLDSIGGAQLSQIAGSVSISITHPPTRPGAVTLDGTPITTFPYTRP